MPKLKPGTLVPTQDEDVDINRGIASDPDTYELTAIDLQQMKRVGRPRMEQPKVHDFLAKSVIHFRQHAVRRQQVVARSRASQATHARRRG